MTKTLSLADIARHFSLPESTARYYCKRFAPFMLIYGEGRRKRYDEECLKVVATIIEHMKMGKTANMVEDFLDTHFVRTLDTSVLHSPRSHTTSQSSPIDHVTAQQITSENSFFDPQSPNAANVHQMATYSQKMPHVENPQNQPMEGAAAQLLMQYLEHQSSALQSIAQSLSTLATQKNDMQRLEDAARTSKEENTLLRKEVHVLKNLLHSTEQIHHDDITQMKTWMSRLATSYNKNTAMQTQFDSHATKNVTANVDATPSKNSSE